MSGPIQAANVPPGFVDQLVLGGWNQAVGLTFASDGRMFVWEKAGVVWTVEGGVKSTTPLIDISEEVGNWGDYGMVGFAVDPDFYVNGYVYLFYVVDYHHLAHFGTPAYNPQTNEYNHDTIGRLTRYTCTAADGFRTVDPTSRVVLIGESITTGVPICHLSHGVGSLVFGRDGSLLASVGDGASYQEVDIGGPIGNSSNTRLQDGIITPKEDVGTFRSQLVDSLNGKILRLDPATGDGLSGNPYFDLQAPRAPRSRVWALGTRNPYRMTWKPGSGSTDPAAGDPGVFYFGEVGNIAWEEFNVCRGPGQNFGWPVYEGFTPNSDYSGLSVPNQDAPNPLFGTTPPGQPMCTQEFFSFTNLLIQDTLDPNPFFPNPCDPLQSIPASIPKFLHRRPRLDWSRNGTARTGRYNGQQAAIINVGVPGSPVSGQQFDGNCSTGGTWYTGTLFPQEYRNTYFHADYGRQWIRQFIMDQNDEPVMVRNFADSAGRVVVVTVDPQDTGLYYISYGATGLSEIRRITWVANQPPVAVASPAVAYGPEPLEVSFDGSGSHDPDNAAPGALVFEWDFGDGSPNRTVSDPRHVFPTADLTAEGTFLGKIFTLNPPHPTGGGNWDPETMRDGDFPPAGNTQNSRQFDTAHPDNDGPDDWLGYRFSSPRRLRGVIFQEGKHFADGGWFEELHIQVEVGGLWSDVTGLVANPVYPGRNSLNYETFNFWFDPIIADGLRIYGLSGGGGTFISVGELRVYGSPTTPVGIPKSYDVTLTVRDAVNEADSETLLVSINNSPPTVAISSPPDGLLIPDDATATVPLTADFSDAEHDTATLLCQWQVVLHHNEHTHPEPFEDVCASQAMLAPHGVGGDTYFYETIFTVTDPERLMSVARSFVYPDPNACLREEDCDDGVMCTLDSCTAGVCGHLTDPAACDDADPCNGMETCDPVSGCLAGVLSADCNANGVEDSCDLMNGVPDLNGNDVPDECERPQTPIPDPVPHNRYLTIDPSNRVYPAAIRVTLVQSEYFPQSVGTTGWVDVPDLTGLARLSVTPQYRVWPEAQVNVGDCLVVPAARYSLVAVWPDLSESPAVFVDTVSRPGARFWADVAGPAVDGVGPPDGRVNFYDLAVAVIRFQGMPSAPPYSWTDLEPEDPNGLVNFADLQRIVDAFQVLPYPFSDPALCPE